MRPPEALRRYFISMEKGCSSNSYVLMVRNEARGLVLEMLRSRCRNLAGYSNVFYRCEMKEGRITFYARTGKVLAELFEGREDIEEFLLKVFKAYQ